MYAGPIIDAHMHLWDLAMGKHPWLAPAAGGAIAGLAAIRRDFLVEDYREASVHHDIAATVHIDAAWETSDPFGEVAWLDTLDKSAGVAARYVAAAPFGSPDAADVIERHLDNPRVVGFRSIASHHPTNPAKSWVKNPDILSDPAWRRDVSILARRGASLDVMMYPYQTDGVLDLAGSFPDLLMIINHCASPIDRDEEGMARWRDAVRRLAQAPNIAIKVNMIGYDPNPTYDAVNAMASHCIDCFGTDRAMFATDWPVCTRYVTYDGLWNNLKRVSAGFSADEQRALFFDNAKRLYRL